MIELGHKNRHFRTVAPKRQTPLHGKLFCDRGEPSWKLLRIDLKTIERPFHAREVQPRGLTRLVLLEMEDVAVMAVDKICDRGVEALAVRALHQQDGCIFQGSLPNRPVSYRTPGTFRCFN